MNYRFERKFLITPFELKEVETLLKLHPLNFHKTYEDRIINSIYYDTEDFRMYFENINGYSERKKIRVRWYGNDLENITNPKFEIKIRNTYLGNKLTYNLKHFEINGEFKEFLNIEDFEKIKILIHDNLKPKVLIRYNRKYFESFDKKIRVTLDSRLEAIKIFSNNSKHYGIPKRIEDEILEIKYNPKYQKEASSLLNKIPLRLTRYSKYVRGIQELY